LAKMELPELLQAHRELFGGEHAVPNTEHLRRKIAWHAQARAEGGLPESARQHALAIARQVGLRVRVCENAQRRKDGISLDQTVTTTIVPTHDSRLPMAGSLLVKEFRNQTIVVKVLDDGFEHDGRRFSSLSSVAREITGTKWNGYVFFGLIKEGSRVR
ncbi:MAG: DUF2924 domain-containing protein, partial [Bryobacteraceae bacterium]